MERTCTLYSVIRRLGAVAMLMLFFGAAHGGSISWDGSDGSFWGEGDNWSGGLVPNAADDVVFDGSAFGFTLNLGLESRSVKSLTFDSTIPYTVENQIDPSIHTLTVGDVTVSSGIGHVLFPPIVLAGDAIYSIAAGTDLRLEESMTGTHSLTKIGDGQVILGRFSPSAGDTIINEGSIRSDNQSALRYRSVTLNVDGGLETNGHLANFGSLAGSGDFDTNGAGVAVGFDDTDKTYAGTLTSIESGSFSEWIEKIGDGTWTLTGADYNIQTGFYVSGGHVIFDGVNGVIEMFASTAGTDITFCGGASLSIGETNMTSLEGFTAMDPETVVNFGSIRYSGEIRIEKDASVNVSSLLDFNGGVLNVDGATMRVSDIRDSVGDGGTIQLSDPSGGTALTLDLAADATFSGVISDSTNGSGSIVKTGIGTLSLGGDNTYTGATVIDEGAILLVPDAEDSNTSLQSTTVFINVDNGLQIDDETSAIYIGALEGSGDYDANGSYVEVGGNNASTTYSGNLTDGFLALRKEGTGTWTLTGSHLLASEFHVADGAVVFDGAGGSLRVLMGAYQPITFQNGANANVINLSGSNVTVDQSSLTVLQVTPFTQTDIIAISDPPDGTALTFNSPADREVRSTLIDHSTGPGSIEKRAANTLTLTAANTFTGCTTISDGRILLGNALALQNSTVHLIVDNGLQDNALNVITLGALAGIGDYHAGSLWVEVGGNHADAIYSGNLTGPSVTFVKEGLGTWTLQGSALAIPSLRVDDGAVIFDGAGGIVDNLEAVSRPLAFQNGANVDVGSLSARSITINSGAVLNVTGDFSLTSGDTLVRTLGDASTFHIAGTASLAGTIRVLFPDGYTPPTGAPLTLATFGSMGAGDPILDTSAAPVGYEYTLEVLSGGATSALSMVVEHAHTVAGFRRQYGLAADGSEDAFDASGNGIANILYFVFDLGDPTEANIDRSRLPTISVESGNLVLTYVRPTATDLGLEIQVMTSDGLVEWFSPDELGPDYLPISETIEPLGDDYITVTQVYPIQAEVDGRFYCVDVAHSDGL